MESANAFPMRRPIQAKRIEPFHRPGFPIARTGRKPVAENLKSRSFTHANPYRYTKGSKTHAGRPNEPVEFLHSSRVHLAAGKLQSRHLVGMILISQFAEHLYSDCRPMYRACHQKVSLCFALEAKPSRARAFRWFAASFVE